MNNMEPEKKDVWEDYDENFYYFGGDLVTEKQRMKAWIKTHFIPRAEVEAKYENCPQCTGLREEFRAKLVEKVESLDLKVIEVTEAEDKGEWVLKIKHKDLLDLIKNNE